jgi:hypothetical protein
MLTALPVVSCSYQSRTRAMALRMAWRLASVVMFLSPTIKRSARPWGMCRKGHSIEATSCRCAWGMEVMFPARLSVGGVLLPLSITVQFGAHFRPNSWVFAREGCRREFSTSVRGPDNPPNSLKSKPADPFRSMIQTEVRSFEAAPCSEIASCWWCGAGWAECPSQFHAVVARPKIKVCR